tara:strand:- start:14791 stop:15192 length:402 start_codon:yes stop_codon:yes gene_type:complete
MPVERISKGFKDLSLSFKRNPLTNDLIVLKNDTAIARSLRNLVMTFTGERFFNLGIGSRVSRLLFDNVTPLTADAIKDEIDRTIRTQEPRVELKEVICLPDYAGNGYDITIKYQVIGIEPNLSELSFVLQSTR